MKKIMITVLLLILGNAAMAAGVPSGPQVNGVYTVESIMADGDGVLRYFTVKETISVCTVQTKQFWLDANYVSKEGKAALLSVLLTAKATDNPITVYYTTADNYCRATLVGLN